MDRSYVSLLVRMSLGLLICGGLWWALRTPTLSSSQVDIAPVAAGAVPLPPPTTSPEENKTGVDPAGSSKESKKVQKAKIDIKQADRDAAIASATAEKKESKMETTTFGGGCFWCVEAVLQRVEGVEKIVSGYSGGKVKSPTYEQVCTGATGHAEVVQVTYDPSKISFVKLLEIFMKTHDPTTLNQQGHDVGTQYRSVIFTHNDQQAQQAKEVIEKLGAAGIFSDPIVTEVEPLKVFYPGEEAHQDYFNRNPSSRYCQVVVRGKVEKLEKFFSDFMKAEAK